MNKKVVKRIGITFLFMLLVGGSCIAFAAVKMQKELEAFDETPVNVENVADGVYEGESETELVKVKVSVEVKDGTIKDVKILKHDCGLGGPANALADKIKEKNDVEIDAVSGATASSKVIKDAVRKALRKGIK